MTSLRVPGRPLGNPPVVVFNLGRGDVPLGRPVAGSTAQWHTAACRADPSHVVSPCFGFSTGVYHLPALQLALQLGPKGSSLL